MASSDLLRVVMACLMGPLLWQQGGAIGESSSGAQETTSVSQIPKHASALYSTLRSVASPSLDLSETTDSRFILTVPGKVLNYFDYYPGNEYTKFIQEYVSTMPEGVVPPHIMEKWFDLADVIPSAYPLAGQDSGKHLSIEYRSILQEIRITNLQQQGDQVIAAYTQAVTFLNEIVPDPENLTINTTRLSLYDRYRDIYNDRKLEMEDLIEQKRKSMISLDYQLWFQRHYPSLQSKVESAYTRWLIFGQKEKVDLYIAYLDSGTSVKILEDARVALRSSGVSSLDRTRTIYPVSFEPSDWYKYLLPEMQTPSRAQLRLMYGKVNAKINVIDKMLEFYNTSNQTLQGYYSDLDNAFQSKQTSANANVQTYLTAELDCIAEQNRCDDLNTDYETVIDSLQKEAEALADREDYPWKSTNKEDYRRYLTNQKVELNTQLDGLEAMLAETNPLLDGILNADQLAVANLSDSHKDDNWLQFSFDSSSSYIHQESSSSHSSFSASGGFGGFFFHLSASYSHTKDTSSFNEALASSDLRVKGKLLRVNIKRPWFKPEVFQDPTLHYVEDDGDGILTYVAPGKDLTEAQFISTITGNQVHYRLPEYVTSFLLARDVELEFSGVDSSTVKDTLSEFSHTSGSGGFFCFGASASETKSHQWSQVTAYKTANGMGIKIPGTQLIGYYTQKLPRFPWKQ